MENQSINMVNAKKFSIVDLDKISSKRIVFGHQSVGYNLIDGIKEICIDLNYKKINIVETRDPKDFTKPILGQCLVGKNQDPISKISDFVKVIDGGVGNVVDIAFFKFCYVDITKDSDIDMIFSVYCDAIQKLQIEYPNVKFLHFTVPLEATPVDFKTTVKRFVNYPAWTDLDNVKRNIFNKKMINKFNQNCFDLAKNESTTINGQLKTFSYKQEKYTALLNCFTDDGGHLNVCGRKVIASKFLSFLGERIN